MGMGLASEATTPHRNVSIAADEAVPEVLAAVTPPRHWSSVVW